MHTPLLLIPYLLVVIFLVLLNGFFVAAEFAIVKIRDTQLEPLINKGAKRAKVARLVIHNIDPALSACQLGITLASLALGWVGEPVFEALLRPFLDWVNVSSIEVRRRIAMVVGFLAITFLHIVVGEQAPKFLAIKNPLPVALWVAQPLQWFHKISFPFIWVLNHSSNWLLKRLGIEARSEAEMFHSREELRLLLSASQETGSTSLGRDVVLNALDLSRREARDVMRPRGELVVLDTDASIAQCLDVAEKTRYSRFPLAEGGDPHKTLGVIHIKDLYALRLRARRGADLLPVARKIVYVPATCRLERLLQLLLDRKLHFSVVVDEYGGTLGFVTLENILEELVGQIQDEFDQEKPLVEKKGDEWKIEGTLPLHELAELAGENLQEEGEEVSTTSGFVTHRLGGFPKEGDTLPLGNYTLRVDRMDGPRVGQLTLKKTTPPDEQSRGESS